MKSAPITVLIADDEPLARSALRRLLADEPGVNVIGEAENGDQAIALIDELKPNLLFLDVQMPGVYGHEVLRRVTHKPLVVFATAFDAYATVAFELNAVDYLLKPFARRRFTATMKRVREVVRSREALRTQEERIARAQTAGPVRDKFFVRDRTAVRAVDIAEVRWIEACDDYARLHVGERRYLVHARMKDLAERLEGLVRIHRSHLINPRFVERVHPEGGGRYTVVLTTGEELPVSRSGAAALKAVVPVL